MLRVLNSLSLLSPCSEKCLVFVFLSLIFSATLLNSDVHFKHYRQKGCLYRQKCSGVVEKAVVYVILLMYTKTAIHQLSAYNVTEWKHRMKEYLWSCQTAWPRYYFKLYLKIADHSAHYFFCVAGFELPRVVVISVESQYELRTTSFSFKFMCSTMWGGQRHHKVYFSREMWVQKIAFIKCWRKMHKVVTGERFL